MVSPGNPLKAEATDMAPLPTRFASAARIARHAPIRATAIEGRLGTRYTAETLTELRRRYPRFAFIWLMGEDNLAGFDRWRRWRDIGRTATIAVFARPGYHGGARRGSAWAWLRRFVRPAAQSRSWTMWRPPALVLLRFQPDPASATALRRSRPDWQHSPFPKGQRDHVTRRPIC